MKVVPLNTIHMVSSLDFLLVCSHVFPVFYYSLQTQIQNSGGLLTSKYFGREGKRVPQEICAAVCVSGGFGMQFANWFRYVDVYQPLIVPEIVSKLFRKYGEERLRQDLTSSQIKQLTYSNSYKTMLSALSSSNSSTTTFDSFPNDIELDSNEIENIDRDFLLMYSLDDPFHHPDMLGHNKATNSNITRLVTKRGGHVSWVSSDPETWLGFGKNSLSFMTETVCDFVDASCMVCDCDNIS